MNIATILATKGKKVITVEPDHKIREAVKLLVQHNIGALVVVNKEQQPVGIISERDIVRNLARHENLLDQPVSAIMTRHLITGIPQDDVYTVANTMTERRIRHLPVLEQGKLIGIVSIGDIVKAQRDQLQGQVDTLQTQILSDQD
ncbi:MAG: CBS domain-containing protein [Chloroflexi bacterium]|nr:MAG: CBS domain-containing protein [Chloroflexota bacterium]